MKLVRWGATLTVVLFMASSTAWAQEDFSRLDVKVGQRVVVVRDGISFSGRVTSLSATALTVGTEDVKPGSSLKIARDRGNTALRGLVMGAALGGTLSLAIGTGWGVLGALPGGWIGWSIGESRDRLKVIYDAPPQGRITGS